jgi:hypothetical protein
MEKRRETRGSIGSGPTARDELRQQLRLRLQPILVIVPVLTASRHIDVEGLSRNLVRRRLPGYSLAGRASIRSSHLVYAAEDLRRYRFSTVTCRKPSSTN